MNFTFFNTIFTDNGLTLSKLIERKEFKASLLILLLLIGIFTFITHPIERVESAEKIRNSSLSEYMDENQLKNLDKYNTYTAIQSSIFSIIITLISLSIAGFFIYIFFSTAGYEGTYSNYFTAVVNASLIDIGIGGLFKTILILIKNTMNINTSLGILFTGSSNKILYLIANQFDIFFILYLYLLGLGIAKISKKPAKKTFLIISLYFIFKAIIVISLSLFTIKFLDI